MAAIVAFLTKAYIWFHSTWVGRIIWGWLKKKLLAFLDLIKWRVKNRAENAAESKAQLQPLKDAQTAEEIDAAADDAFSKL